jgi:Flp pilus assembly protein TadG
MKCLLGLAPGREFAQSRDGAVAIEFALVSLPFLAIVIALFQLGILFLAQQELETAVEKTGRLVLTGQAQTQSLTQSDFSKKVCASLPALFNCPDVMVDMQTATSFADADTSAPKLTYDAQGKVSNTWLYRAGTPGDIVVLRVMYLWPTFLGPLNFKLANLSNGKRLLMATAVFKNESY